MMWVPISPCPIDMENDGMLEHQEKSVMTSVQSFAGWKRAFDHAKDTEAEGAKYFEGFFKKLRRTDESLTFEIGRAHV